MINLGYLLETESTSPTDRLDGRVQSIKDKLNTFHLSYWMNGSAEHWDGRDRGKAGLRWSGRIKYFILAA